MSWSCLHWNDQEIEHRDDRVQMPFYVHAETLAPMRAMMETHGFVCRIVRPVPGEHEAQIWIDPGGMCSVGAPEELLEDFFGAPIGIRSEDVAWALRRFSEPKEHHRQPIDGEVYAFGSYMRFLIVTNTQRLRLVEWLTEIATRAEARAIEFYATRQTPHEALAEHNASRGSITPGVDKLRRFRGGDN